MLATRAASALVMGALFLLAVFYLEPVGWAIMILAIAALASWEWTGLVAIARPGRGPAAACLTGICAWAALWTGAALGQPQAARTIPFYLAGGAFWLLLVPFWLRVQPAAERRLQVAAAGIAALLPASLALLELRTLGAWPLLAVMSIVWIADSAAYFCGRRFGRHKLAPTISPGKSWEGVGGAVLVLAVYAALLPADGLHRGAAPLAAPLRVAGVVVLGLVSVLGDLFESSLKRGAGIKDSGHIIPGHGGVLDRLDALLAMLPFALIGLHWISRPT
jgi:phosphatidate cytidylyltransferase